MNCPECGNKVRPGSLFCQNCGTQLPGMDSAPASQPESRPGKQKKTGIILAIVLVAFLLAGLALRDAIRPRELQYWEPQDAPVMDEKPQMTPVEPEVTDACYETLWQYCEYRIPQISLGGDLDRGSQWGHL